MSGSINKVRLCVKGAAVGPYPLYVDGISLDLATHADARDEWRQQILNRYSSGLRVTSLAAFLSTAPRYTATQAIANCPDAIDLEVTARDIFVRRDGFFATSWEY